MVKMELIERTDRSALLAPYRIKAFIKTRAGDLLRKYGDHNPIFGP